MAAFKGLQGGPGVEVRMPALEPKHAPRQLHQSNVGELSLGRETRLATMRSREGPDNLGKTSRRLVSQVDLRHERPSPLSVKLRVGTS